MKAPLPKNEEERLKALHQYEILDTTPEQEFDDITLLASHICKTPIALISLIDENRQWFKSKIGMTENETSRDIAFCAHGILQAEVFVVNDAQADKRFASNPLVTGNPKIRFYAGAPLITADGHALGMLCVTDQVPRDLSAEQKGALQALGRQVVAQLEQRRSAKKLRQTITQLKQTQEELSWKTAFLEAKLNSSIDGTLVVNERGQKILQNKKFTDLLKIPKHIAEDNDDGKQLKWITDATKTPEQFIERVLYLNSHPNEISRDEIEFKDGAILDRYSAPVVGKDGKHYGRIWTFRDITERKQMEESLRESEEKFRQLADNITDVFWMTSPDLNIMHYISPGYELIWGRSMESLYANPHQWVEAILPEERERVFAIFGTLMQNKAMVSVEYQISRPDGAIRWIHDRGFQVRNAAGNLVRLAGIATDITERKHAQESLRLLGSAVEQAKESIMITDAELDLPGPRIIFVNPAFTKITGYNEEDVMGKTPRILQGPRTDKSVLSRLRQNLERGKMFEGETINYRKDGKEFDLEWQVAPIRNAGGIITHFVAIQRDITERKRVESHLFQSQKMETVGKLAAGIAHEFNSIMTAIIGQSELILGDLPSGNPLIENATEIHKAAERAATLTRQLLAYGRKQTLRPEILDLNSVLAGMETMLRNLAGKDVDVRIALAPALGAVKADAGQIEQVIVNIAMNAADAMPNGGKLTLETADITLDNAYVSRLPELKVGAYVMLAITDTGAGMSEEVKARLFEPFFTTKGVGNGTGLGLAMCHGIVKQSGGHIAVYSEPGRGTTFKIYLPQIKQELKPPTQIKISPVLPGGVETILLVEDDPSLREMGGALLKRLGYTVLTAANGVEALTLANQQNTGHIDLLFTDVVMPHMSGKELSDRVRALFPQTKILFTSAYTENAVIHQDVLNKSVVLLQKPFTPSALAHKVREILNAKKTN